MKSLKFRIDEDLYDIRFDSLSIDRNEGIDAENVLIMENGKKMTSFGENFAGHRYNANEVLEFAIAAYLNNNEMYKFVEIPEEIVKAGKKMTEYAVDLNGHRYTKTLYNSWLNEIPLQMVTDLGAVYDNGEGCAYLDEKGNVVTDIEAFMLSAAVDMYKNAEILYITDDYRDYMECMAKDE